MRNNIVTLGGDESPPAGPDRGRVLGKTGLKTGGEGIGQGVSALGSCPWPRGSAWPEFLKFPQWDVLVGEPFSTVGNLRRPQLGEGTISPVASSKRVVARDPRRGEAEMIRSRYLSEWEVCDVSDFS